MDKNVSTALDALCETVKISSPPPHDKTHAAVFGVWNSRKEHLDKATARRTGF